MKILIVDDSSMMRRLIKKILRDLGYKDLESAANGHTALEMIEKSLYECDPYELIISDWFMPQMNGYELLQYIRSDERFSKIRFLMVTQQSLKQEIENAIHTGVDDYIIKPFTPGTLKNKVEWISRKIKN